MVSLSHDEREFYNRSMTLTGEDKHWIKDAIAEAFVEAFETLFVPRFDEIDRRLDKLEHDVKELQIQMVSVIRRLDVIEGRLQAVESDVKELYFLNRGSATSPA